MDALYGEQLISLDIRTRLKSLLEPSETVESPKMVPETAYENPPDNVPATEMREEAGEEKDVPYEPEPMAAEEEKTVKVAGSSESSLAMQIPIPVLVLSIRTLC